MPHAKHTKRPACPRPRDEWRSVNRGRVLALLVAEDLAAVVAEFAGG